MLKLVLIVVCVFMLVGMIALDFFITHDFEKPGKKDKQNNDEVNKNAKN